MDDKELKDGSRNLDWEERVVLLSRINKLKTLLTSIHGIVSRLLGLESVKKLPETVKDQLKDVRDISKVDRED